MMRIPLYFPVKQWCRVGSVTNRSDFTAGPITYGKVPRLGPRKQATWVIRIGYYLLDDGSLRILKATEAPLLEPQDSFLLRNTKNTMFLQYPSMVSFKTRQ